MIENLKIPRGSIPLAAGLVCEVDAEVVKVTETIPGTVSAFNSTGDDSDFLIKMLTDDYNANLGSSLYRFGTE